MGVSIFQRRDRHGRKGVWYAQVTLHGIQYPARSLHTRDRTTAEIEKRTLEAQIARGSYTPSSERLTVTDAITTYLADTAETRAAGTAREYSNILLPFSAWLRRHRIPYVRPRSQARTVCAECNRGDPIPPNQS